MRTLDQKTKHGLRKQLLFSMMMVLIPTVSILTIVQITMHQKFLQNELIQYTELLRANTFQHDNPLSMSEVNQKIRESQQQMLYQSEILLFRLIMISFLMLIIAAVLIVVISQKISKPIVDLTDTAAQFAIGNFNAPIKVDASSSINEVSVLADTIIHMAKNVQQSHQHLKQNNELLEQRVKERTSELVNMVTSLQQTNVRLKHSQEQLIQAEKMASLGQLVAGIAHEINTPVGIGITGISHVVTLTQQVKKQFNGDELDADGLDHYLDIMLETCELVYNNLQITGDLVKSFKMVACDQTSEEHRVFILCDYLKDIVRSLKPEIKNKLWVRLECAKLIEVNGFPGVIAQILTNLILNAMWHAYPDAEGKIEIKARLLDNDIINIKIIDFGKGISSENQQKIFDPFFTTNRANGGTGLGLNIIYNLVHDKLKGAVVCHSKLMQGTTFVIEFPRVL